MAFAKELGRRMKKNLYFMLLILFLLNAGCTNLFFYPEKEFIDNPAAKKLAPLDVYFKTPDRLKLHGWFFQAKQEARATILFIHGNARNLSVHAGSVLWLVDEGFNVFIFDYRGYGRSEGKPGIDGIHLDAEAALETLLTLPGVNKDRIVVFGHSLGGAVAVYTAANTPYKDLIKTLVIDSAFSGYQLIAQEKLAEDFVTWPLQYPLSVLFINDYYSPVRWIKKVSPVPLLILHTDKDEVVPAHHSRILYDAALQPKELWQAAVKGHVSSFTDESVRKKFIMYISNLFQK